MAWIPRLYVRRVSGASMLPALPPGRIIVAYSKYRPHRRGEVIIFRHDGLDKVKRVADIRPGALFVLGDNSAASIDSRQFGWLPAKAVLGKVIVMRRPARARFLKSAP